VAKYKPILIGCPQYTRLIRGSYECDDRGRYLLAPDGTFALPRVRCGQYGGRCMQTLCVLHRFNRRGSGSWFPSQILAMDEAEPKRRSTRQPRPQTAPADKDMDLLC